MIEKPTVATAQKRIKIDFNTVDIQSDVSIRLFFDTLKRAHLPVLEEILHSSARTPIDELLEDLDMKKSELAPILEHLKKSGLLKVENDEVVVVKEVRRLIESHFKRTEEDFEPDIEFALTALKVLPVQQVPLWYALPKTSTSLREALIEKFFETPIKYRRHLDTTQFDDPALQLILKKLRKEPVLDARSLKKELEVSDEQFHRLVLVLELNFIAYLKYAHENKELQPQLTIIREYREYITHTESGALFNKPKELPAPLRSGPFSFLKDLDAFVACALKSHLPQTLSLSTVQAIARELEMTADHDYIARLWDRALKLRLLEIGDGELIEGANLKRWKKLSENDRPFCYLRHPALTYESDEKSIRAAEKSISLITGKGWVAFDDFIRAALIPLRPEIEVRLTGRGRSCHYAFPEYTEEEKALVHHIIFEALAESGFVETADDYFCLTDFGELVFGPQE